MKKIIMIIATLVVMLTSCSKKNCNCGEVLQDDARDLSVMIKNDCSGNVEKFYLSYGQWMNAQPGTNYCIYSVESW
tara:strand:- start:1421 stop:1648 length:228 start_codon:yes stop_codon:yes gene_type:complete